MLGKGSDGRSLTTLPLVSDDGISNTWASVREWWAGLRRPSAPYSNFDNPAPPAQNGSGQVTLAMQAPGH